MTVPLIGIVADRKSASYGAWVDIPTDAISHTYVSAIQEAGGAPLLFPSIDVHVDDPERLLDLIDGLFLPGGRDLDASLYASEAHPLERQAAAGARRARDRPHPARPRARHARARRLSRTAGDQRGARRHARAAPRRSPRPRRRTAPRSGRTPRTRSPSSPARCSVTSRTSSSSTSRRTTTRASTSSARGSGPRRAPPTVSSRPSRPSTAASASACSGTPRSGSTPRASRSSVRSSPRRARGPARSSRFGRRASVVGGALAPLDAGGDEPVEVAVEDVRSGCRPRIRCADPSPSGTARARRSASGRPSSR